MDVNARQESMPVYDCDGPRERTTIKVGVADYAISDDGSALKTSGLGSCLGIALYDERAGVCGFGHAMLPIAGDNVDNEAKFADSCIEGMLREMEALGADRTDVRAKLAGGSNMLSLSVGRDIGERNAASARATLAALDVPVEAADVGGSHGRSLVFRPVSADLEIRSVGRGVTVL